MEHSLHRVSLGSRRAHPGLSFYLTTFGKCAFRLASKAAAPCTQRPGRAQVSLLYGDTFSGSFLLWLSSTGSEQGLKHSLRPSKPPGTTCCLATGAKCSWFCLTGLE